MSQIAVPSKPPLRSLAWLMIVVGTLLSVWPHRTPLRLYYSAALLVFGVGLLKQYFWAWEGATYLAVFCAEIALALPFIAFDLPISILQMLLIYSIMTVCLSLPSVFLVRHLVRPETRAAFEMSMAEGSSSPDSWIRLIAMAFLSCAGLMFLEVLRPEARPLFGFLKNRVLFDVYCGVVGALAIYVGYGLYKLRRWARLLAIGCIWLLQGEFAMSLLDTSGTKHKYMALWVILLALTIALSGIQNWYLHHRRDLFWKS